MNTDNSFSVNTMSKKRERVEKGERLNARAYKKLFQNAGQKMKKKESQGGDHHITASVASKAVEEPETNAMKSCSDSKHEKHSAELSELQFEVSSEIRDHVKKLRDYWHIGQNTLFFDGQDRIIKVVQFVLSILDSVKQPILIITPSRSLSLWEIEFPKWSKSTNVVTYKDNKDVRDVIRSNEFYTEKGSVKFQVLLSSPDVILEDLEMLDHIKWELIVIDECQRATISKIFRKIKTLTVDMKLLTVTSEIVDVRQIYPNLLSLLDSKYEETHTDADVDTKTLKERLSPFVAFECNLKASEIEEYWVPVHLSQVQIEQYCSLLTSNSDPLLSSLRNLNSLHDILTQTQKCCDHPYLVDPTLRENLKTDIGDDQLDAEISVSGKLQLLDKLLVEIKRRGLRVLVLFQSVVSSEKITIGDILEDLVDRRFGQEAYVRILPKMLSKIKRKEAVDIFNNIENGAFICLLEYRDCQSTNTLSSVDVAILFNSNWNPTNDVKDLHKLTLDSNSLRVLRLYSAFTIEEKPLIISKQGASLETTHRINYNTCHRLLAWGSSYLFKKLSEDPNSKSKSDSEVDDLSSLLLNNKSSIESMKVSQCDGVYSGSIRLMGESENTKDSCSIEEYLMENEPNLFWSNLFKENTPKKSSGRLARRAKMSFRSPYYWFGGYEYENDHDKENAITSSFVKTKLRSKRKKRLEIRKSKLKGGQLTRVPSTRIPYSRPLTSSTNDVNETPNTQPQTVTETLTVTPQVCDQSSETTPLGTELENIKKEQEKVTKLHEEKESMLLSECEKEILEIRKKYDTLIEDSKMCLTEKMKVLEEYYHLVYANNLLAHTLSEANLEETDTVRIVEIPASELVQSEKKYTSTTSMASISAPPPHLRSSSSVISLFTTPPTMPFMGSYYGTC